MRYDWLIVGAGFTGATLAERIASQLGETVLMVDRRNHIAGNAYDEMHECGVLVHKYGPHIFHTNSAKVWTYLSRFTEWRPYFHHVLGHVDGKFVPIPFNLNSIGALFTPSMAERMSDALVERYGFGKKIPIMKLRDDPDDLVKFLATYVYEKVFVEYTKKQWGLTPDELGPGVTARVPVTASRDDRYFDDRYQAMPKHGYTAMFRRMLDVSPIRVELDTDWREVPETSYRHMVFTGPIDEYFGYEFGPLPYRSIRFENVVEDAERCLPVGTMNYPNEFDFTRVTEQKVITGSIAKQTVLTYEFPQAYARGQNEPYYPIPNQNTQELLRPYQSRAAELRGKIWFAGRLGDYAYYNMDQACARALSLFEREIAARQIAK